MCVCVGWGGGGGGRVRVLVEQDSKKCIYMKALVLFNWLQVSVLPKKDISW